MPNVFRQSNSAQTAAVAFPGVATSGDTIYFGIATIMGSGGPPTVTVTDTAGNTYTQAGAPAGPISYAGFPTFLFSFTALHIVPGSGNITATAVVTPAAALNIAAIGEWGPVAGSIIDPTAYGQANGSTLAVTVSSTLAGSGELLVGCFFNAGANSTTGAGWTQREYTANGSNLMLVDQLSGPAAGAQTFTLGSLMAAGTWVANIVGLYVPSPGPPATSAVFPLPVYKAIGIL